MQALTQRDKIVLAMGGVAVLLFVLVQFVVMPLMDRRERLRRNIDAKRQAIAEMAELKQRFQRIQAQAEGITHRFAVRPADFSLFAFLDRSAADAKVKDHIAYMKPSESADTGQFRESMVEMKLQEVGIGQLVNFLDRIESPEMIVLIKRVSIQENKKEADTLDAIMQVVTLDALSEGGEKSE